MKTLHLPQRCPEHCIDFASIACRRRLRPVSHTVRNDRVVFIPTLVAVLCSVDAILQGTSATPARHHRGTLHCDNHSSTGDSISSERLAFQVPSLHRVEEESSQAQRYAYR